MLGVFGRQFRQPTTTWSIVLVLLTLLVKSIASCSARVRIVLKFESDDQHTAQLHLRSAAPVSDMERNQGLHQANKGSQGAPRAPPRTPNARPPLQDVSSSFDPRSPDIRSVSNRAASAIDHAKGWRITAASPQTPVLVSSANLMAREALRDIVAR